MSNFTRLPRVQKAEQPRVMIRKGLYEVSRIASLTQELSYLRGCCGDSDPELYNQVANLCDLLTDMVAEAKENLVMGDIPSGAYVADTVPAPRPY